MADTERSDWQVGAQPRGIGRGLSAILPQGQPAVEGLRELPVELIEANPDQPRREIEGESLLALAESIRARGILQPVVVRSLAGGRFELIAGERRLRASKLAGLERIPALVRQAAESERLELALMENMAREDLNAVDEARACATLVEDLGVTKEELGRRLGRSRVAISNLIRILDLPDEALALIHAGELSEGHGRALLMNKDQPTRGSLAREAALRGWSVRETERRAKAASGSAPLERAAAAAMHPDLADSIAAAEDTLTAALGYEIRVRPRGGRFRAEFDLDDPREAVQLAERILRRAAV